MIDASRRGILKMFGVAGAVVATGVSTEVAIAAAKSRGWESPFELVKAPAGMTYNWKRIFVDGKMADFGNIAQMVMAGWQPVPLERHREQYPDHPQDSHWIEIGGVVLMEKPTQDTSEPKTHPLPWEG